MSDGSDNDSGDDDLRTPLARFGGARPPAPAWFARALACAPERRRIEVESAAIELLVWPGPAEAAKPGLLFIHGGWAHADWWSFIAPFFADERPCAALSLSGMGASDRRDGYGHNAFMAEAFAAIEAAGLGEAPLVVAHSFGGGVATHMAARAGERLGGIVLLDAGVFPPERRLKGLGAGRNLPVRPSFEAQLARFRLAPPQPCENLFLVDHVARTSIRRATDREGEGWIWTFDPYLWDRVTRDDRMPSQEDELAAARCPVAIVAGDRSLIVDAEILAHTVAHAPPGSPVVMIPDCGHHVMLDQPLALVAALRAMIAPGLWARSSPDGPHTRT